MSITETSCYHSKKKRNHKRIMPVLQPTKKQHYVPKTYLQGFSQDAVTIYEYNLNTDTVIDKPVTIESICRERYLYEIRDNNGEFISVNFIENILCGYEGQFAEYRRTLLSKTANKANYKTRCFLSKAERDFWVFYTALQIMRHPVTLRGVKDIIQDEFPGQYSSQEAYNNAIAYCLPFFREPKPNDLNALSFFLYLMQSKILTVCYAASDHVFTSEHAMYGSSNSKESLFDFKSLWFPVSSNCVLLFSAPDVIDGINRNCLIPISEETVRDINKGIAYIAKQMVLSKYPFTESDIQLIREARSERSEEDVKRAELFLRGNYWNQERNNAVLQHRSPDK